MQKPIFVAFAFQRLSGNQRNLRTQFKDKNSYLYMKHLILFVHFVLSLLLISCASGSQEDTCLEGISIDFGNPQSIKFSDIATDFSFVKLESSDSSLFGNIDQIEIFNERIYILDSYNTHSLLVFSLAGDFITKLEAKGNGPGEFIDPYSFKIDPMGYIYILDRISSRLLKYKLNSLEFVEMITLPYPSPLSFSMLSSKNLFVYYYPIRRNSDLGRSQIVIADKTGKIIKTLYEGDDSGKILHGNPDNIYRYEDSIRIYPYFTNQIYNLGKDSLSVCYDLSWGKREMPDKDLFKKTEDSNQIMKEILAGENDWIRLLYVYELDDALLTKYYIKRDFYLSGWNKRTHTVFNVKAENIIDDSGIGAPFPLPIGVYDQQLIGTINPYEINRKKVQDKELRSFLNNLTDESNPLLVFFFFLL